MMSIKVGGLRRVLHIYVAFIHRVYQSLDCDDGPMVMDPTL